MSGLEWWGLESRQQRQHVLQVNQNIKQSTRTEEETRIPLRNETDIMDNRLFISLIAPRSPQQLRSRVGERGHKPATRLLLLLWRNLNVTLWRISLDDKIGGNKLPTLCFTVTPREWTCGC